MIHVGFECAITVRSVDYARCKTVSHCRFAYFIAGTIGLRLGLGGEEYKYYYYYYCCCYY